LGREGSISSSMQGEGKSVKRTSSPLTSAKGEEEKRQRIFLYNNVKKRIFLELLRGTYITLVGSIRGKGSIQEGDISSLSIKESETVPSTSVSLEKREKKDLGRRGDNLFLLAGVSTLPGREKENGTSAPLRRWVRGKRLLSFRKKKEELRLDFS